MQVLAETKSLLLKLKDPTKVTDVIPRSRVREYKGVPITQVYHGLDEVRVLRNLGFNAPSPIETQYSWRGRYTPFKHQATTSAFLTLNRRAIVLNDMGTGKSLSALWAADYLMDLGLLRKAIIVSPISTMHSVWEQEVSEHFMFNRKAVVVYGSRERRQQLLADPDADFYIINHDGLKTIKDDLADRDDIDLWIVDEAAVYRNAQTNRYKLAKKLIPDSAWLWMLTGTPCPTSPTDAWALAKLLGSPKAPKYFTGFRDEVMVQLTQYKWTPKPDAYAKAYDILQPGIRFKKEDCIDLPPVSFQLRRAELTKEQDRLYAQMQKDLVMDVAGSEVTAANAATKLLKLLQVVTGAVYDEDSDTLQVDATKRLKVLEELVEESSHKVLVFVPFTAALKKVAAHLGKRWSVEIVDGSTSVKQRKRIFGAFQKEADPQVIVAHPATTAHGLTLTAADHTIWYAPIFSLEVFEQANNRMNRPGQVNNMTVSMIASNAMEMQLYKALYLKQRMQESVLSLYKAESSIQ